MVAVPTLLTGVDDVEEQVDQLEVHYLANPDGDVRFALVSDWADATDGSGARRRRDPRRGARRGSPG